MLKSLYSSVIGKEAIKAVVAAMLVSTAVSSLVCGPASAQTAVKRHATPPDSYLQYRVYTVDQLIEQVSTNTTVRQRFARHFRIPEDQVVPYMRANLVESYVPSTARYTVYCVRPSGKFFPVRQTFHRGTKVFALRNGEPVMKWLCGNPLSRFLPDVEMVHHVASAKPPIVQVSPSIQELTPSEPMNVLVPSEEQVYQARVPAYRTSAVFPVSAVHGGISPLPLLGLILLAPHSGHSNGSPIAAVPEASSLAYVGLALPMVLVFARRRAKPLA